MHVFFTERGFFHNAPYISAEQKKKEKQEGKVIKMKDIKQMFGIADLDNCYSE